MPSYVLRVLLSPEPYHQHGEGDEDGGIGDAENDEEPQGRSADESRKLFHIRFWLINLQAKVRLFA